MKIVLYVLLGMFAVVIGGFFILRQKLISISASQPIVEFRQIIAPPSEPGLETFIYEASQDQPMTKVSTTTNEVLYSVPFTTQAPYAVWDRLHEEACEEAVLVMAYAWRAGMAVTTQDFAETELQKLVTWGKNNLVSYESSPARDIARMAQGVYSINPRVIDNITLDDIMNELRQGNLVGVGAAGQLLLNTHFTPPGPVYHMLLFVGFNDQGFFVNDAGTKFGAQYFYTNEILQQALHDWSGDPATLTQTPPVGLVFTKN